jgi:D-inositol-3-phosphate glycosyltransferase
MPVDPLLTQLAAMEGTPAVGRAWHRDVARFEDQLARRLAERFEGQRSASSSPDGGADITLQTADGAVLAVEVKTIRYSAGFSNNLRNRMQELLATSVSIRRALRGSGALVGIIGIIAPPQAKWNDALAGPDPNPLRRLVEMTEKVLLRDSDGVGFDDVVIGLAADDGEWLVVNPEIGRKVVPTFSAVMDEVATVSPSESGVPDNHWPRPGGNGPTRVLLVADEWTSSHGGLSTINRELAVALAARGADVAVVVPSASPDDRDSAGNVNVNLVSPAYVPGLSPRELLCTRPVTVPADYCPDVVIGHGRVLGPHAEVLRAQFYPTAKRVHIVHTDAESLEAAKETPGGPSRMSVSDERRELETKLAISADLVVGVGPLLTDAIRHSMRGRGRAAPQVLELTPGLRDWGETVDADDPPQRNQVLVLARAEDPVSKGLDIAASAVVDASTRLGTSQRFRPALVVRGVPEGDEADGVKKYLESIAQPAISVFLRPFSDDESSIHADLWQSRVVLMPSRHEGFGLAALEAIAAGVPVLISEESGLARLLERELGEDFAEMILPTQGDLSRVAAVWGEALAERLKGPIAAFGRAKALRERLSAIISWRTAADALLEAIC